MGADEIAELVRLCRKGVLGIPVAEECVEQLVDAIKTLTKEREVYDTPAWEANERLNAALEEQIARAEKAEAEIAETKELLQDPAAVWANMLRGGIAIPTHFKEEKVSLLEAIAIAYDRIEDGRPGALDVLGAALMRFQP
jgi:hypothetical protein